MSAECSRSATAAVTAVSAIGSEHYRQVSDIHEKLKELFPARGLCEMEIRRCKTLFSLEVCNNNVIFIDPQSAKQNVIDYFDKVILDRIVFGRVDNIALNETVINAVINRR